MTVAFYLAAAIAVLATLKAITEFHAVRALLYLIVSLLSTAVVFFILGAPFAAALEVITYAGAIMVLFVFVMMMLNLGPRSARQESQWQARKMWVGPAVLAFALWAEVVYAVPRFAREGNAVIAPELVGVALFGRYAAGVEIASLLLLAGLLGAYHLGRSE